MKKIYIAIFALLCSVSMNAQDLVITGVFDGDLPGGLPEAIEIYVVNDIADLSTYGFGSANNGGGTDGIEFQLSGTATAGDYLYIATEDVEFNNYFGFTPDFISGAAGINGDDAVELFDSVTDDGMGGLTGTVIDTYGQLDVNGDGTAWDYTDGWAYRADETGPDGASWVEANWTYAFNANDGETSQGTATNPWPLGTYIASATNANAEINFTETLLQVNENDGTVTVEVSISETATLDVDVILGFTNDTASSFNYTTTTLSFTDGGATTQTATVALNDNTDLSIDYVIVLELENNTAGTIGEDNTLQLFVLDNETHAPAATDALGMTFETSFEIDGAEIVTHDATSQRLFVSNSGGNTVEVLDFSDPTNLSLANSVDMSAFGEEVTSVSAFNGVIAVVSKAADQGDGTIIFIDTDGTVLSNVTVGSLPDMVTFTPDGTKVLVACEGEPNDDYTIDPEGTVAIINVVGGGASVTQADVTLLNFNAFDANQTALVNAGVRVFGPNATLSQDLEPEYITVSEDGTQAYVALQENNAYATINLTETGGSISSVVPFGFKDHNLPENAFDATNRLDFVFMSTWNTLGMYQPDAIATYNTGGTNYLVIANEGDARDYDGFSEEVRVKDLNLDPSAYPDAAYIQQDETLGRLNATTATGDTDGDGDIDQIYNYGGRSFAIFNADNGALVFDSGDLLERITKEDPEFGVIFNATNDENAFKNRSDDKGPEPEAVIVKEINGRVYAFIGLERIGGIATFDITDPASPTFEKYVNNRDTTLDLEDPDGDLAPEGVIYIAPEDNATDRGLIVVANEVSATISVYRLENNILATDDLGIASSKMTVYPNPVTGGVLNFSEISGYEVYDITGRLITTGAPSRNMDTTPFSTGMYLVRFDNESTQKVIIK